MISDWDKVSKEYDELVENKDYLRGELLNEAVLNLWGDLKEKKIIDAGCGQGYFSSLLADKGAVVTGVDSSKNLIGIAKEKYGSKAETFLVHDLKKEVPFKDESFDGVLCNMAFMDFEPIEFTVEEFFRILKLGGEMVFSIPHPVFFAGKLNKNMWEKLTDKLPHYKIHKYGTPFKKDLKIFGLSKKTSYYHRPIEYYVSLFIEKGFEIKKFKEPRLSKENKATKVNNFLKLCREIPPFLIIKVEKPT